MGVKISALPAETAPTPADLVPIVHGGVTEETTIGAILGLDLRPCGSIEVTFGTTAGTVDGTAFTVPASPSGNGRFLLVMVIVRLSVAIVGTGNVVLRVGTTTGGNEIVTDSAAITSSGAVGDIEGGVAISSLGASMLATQGYTAVLAAGATVKMRATTSGTLSAGKAVCYVYGCFLP